jgi:hypothetical protein
MGRNFAGVHYRSDAVAGLNLGEKVALSVLMEEGYLYNEDFKGFVVTKFNGTKVVVGAKQAV